MPRIVRPMFSDTADPQRPAVGITKSCLGVRTTGTMQDVDLDAGGKVILNCKGLSVSKDWRDLPDFLIPPHLEDELNGASGKVGTRVFVHEVVKGPFAQGPVAKGLELFYKVGNTAAGIVCPTACVLLAQYQADLAATKFNWIIDES